MNAGELLIDAITTVPYIAAMIVDKQGYVVFVNRTYLKMLKRTEKETLIEEGSKCRRQSQRGTLSCQFQPSETGSLHFLRPFLQSPSKYPLGVHDPSFHRMPKP